jgi:hypothetical protein
VQESLASRWPVEILRHLYSKFVALLLPEQNFASQNVALLEAPTAAEKYYNTAAG